MSDEQHAGKMMPVPCPDDKPGCEVMHYDTRCVQCGEHWPCEQQRITAGSQVTEPACLGERLALALEALLRCALYIRTGQEPVMVHCDACKAERPYAGPYPLTLFTVHHDTGCPVADAVALLIECGAITPTPREETP
jgi:hypothetical protein